MPQGFVRVDPETNDEYLSSFRDGDDWRPVILETHSKLLAIDPAYRISQIKSKFGGLRYYYDSTFAWKSDEGNAMDAVVRDAEAQIDAIEAAKR